MQDYSLAYVLQLWCESDAMCAASPTAEKYLIRVLRHYILPEALSLESPLKLNYFKEICPKISVQNLVNSLSIFEYQTESKISQNQLSKKTRDNYRSALKRFMAWLCQQIWWRELFPSTLTNEDVAPFRSQITPKTTKGKRPPYGLSMDQLPVLVLKELDDFKQFRLTGGRLQRLSWRERRQAGIARIQKPKVMPVKPSTLKKEEQGVLRFLGWYTQAYPDAELTLALITDECLIDEYVYWAITTRQVSYCTALHMAGLAVAIAKWLNYEHATRRNWFDVPLVLALQDLEAEYAEYYAQEKHQARTQHWAQKLLTHDQAREVVQYLFQLCAPNYGKHDPETREFRKHGTRPTSAVVRAWQTYLLVKILVYCPIRQEEIRAWKLGETLFRKLDQAGEPYYEVRLSDHKRKTQTRRDRHYRLPAILTADLDIWVYKWRPLLVEAVKTLDNWTDFWGYGGGKVQRIQERVEQAQQGIVAERVEQSIEQYTQQELARLQGAQNRLAAWPEAKANLATHNYLFFILAKREPASFGKPHYVASVWRLVNRAIAHGSKALFGEERWTNPHALRHIAEAHIRSSGNSHIAEAFGALIGHSKEMGDAYAEQVISEYDLVDPIVDDWWE